MGFNMIGEEYTCAMCKGVFKKGQSDEEAMAETRENFGDTKQEDCDIVCDGCYEQIFPQFPEAIKQKAIKLAKVRK